MREFLAGTSFRTLPAVAALLVVLLTVSTNDAHSEGREKFDKWLPIPDWTWDDSRYQGMEHAAVLYEGHVIDDSSLESGQGRYGVYQSVRVLDTKGIEQFATVEIPYSDEMKFSRLEARTLKPDGSVIELDDTDFHDKIVIEWGKDRVQAKAFAFKAVEPGDVLEYRFEWKGPMDAPPPVMLGNWCHTFVAEITWLCKVVPDVVRSDWRYQHYAWDAVYVITNSDESLVTREPYPDERDSRGTYFRFENIPPFPDELFRPALEEVATSFVGHYRNPDADQRTEFWQRVSDNLGESVNEYRDDAARLDEVMGAIIAQERDLDRDLDLLAQLVRDRWECEELRPASARVDEIDSPRSVKQALGTRVLYSYDIGRMFVSMLDRLGYEATMFMARSNETGPFLGQWQSFEQFDHSGVAVRDGEAIRWCYPAAPYGSISVPWQLLGQNALLASSLEEKDPNPWPLQATIPLPAPESNRVQLSVSLTPDEDLRARGRLEAVWASLNDIFEDAELRAATRDEALDQLRARVLPDEVHWRAIDETFSLEGTTVSYACSLEVEGIVENAGSMFLVDASDLRIDALHLGSNATPRASGLRYPFPVQYRSSLVVHAPEGFEVDSGPRSYRGSESFLDATLVPLMGTDQVKLERTVALRYSSLKSLAAAPLSKLLSDLDTAAADPVVFARSSGIDGVQEDPAANSDGPAEDPQAGDPHDN